MGLRKSRRDAMAASDGLFEDQPALSSMRSITLQNPVDLGGFRRVARKLMAQGISHEWVSWHSSDDKVHDLFGEADESVAGALASAVPESAVVPDRHVITVPAEFLQLCQTVILHRDGLRFGLLYRLLWRLQYEPGLRHDPLDADRMQAQRMALSVRRDMHKMKAFVRFRTVQDEAFKSHPENGPLHVAWFEPEHRIVQAIAPFFARRFTQMRWAILTPDCSVEWDGASLRFGPGARKADAPPPDAGEQLWLTYYQNTFNPARLKLKAMQKEMPRRYWKNLPEAQLISGLAADAGSRRAAMIGQAPTLLRRRIPTVPPAVAATSRRARRIA